jgi:hypothetical protein
MIVVDNDRIGSQGKSEKPLTCFGLPAQLGGFRLFLMFP